MYETHATLEYRVSQEFPLHCLGWRLPYEYFTILDIEENALL
jgi:hypothetical protein